MNCAWNTYLNLLPMWMRAYVDRYGRDVLQELRLRIGFPPELITTTRQLYMDRNVNSDDISFCINAASKYSPWSASSSAYGYITAAGGHRIGICGEVTLRNGVPFGISIPRFLCIRVARDYVGISKPLSKLNGSILLIGPPVSGKTTLLRDIIRQISYNGYGSVGVVDERGELFPFAAGGACFDSGPHTDILTGCDKEHGIDMVLRTMGPSAIAVDEITERKDCDALIHAGWCGVKLLATAHAHSAEDLYKRPVYRPLIESGLFDYLIVLCPDKTYTWESMSNVL